MLYNEICEVGQLIALFDSSITNRDFKRLVLLVRPIGATFMHKYNGDNYNLQEWRYTNPDGSTGHTYLSLGKVKPLRFEYAPSAAIMSDYTYAFTSA